MPLYSFRLFREAELLIEQDNIQADGLWGLLRVLAGDCREELEEGDRLEVCLTRLKARLPEEDDGA